MGDRDFFQKAAEEELKGEGLKNHIDRLIRESVDVAFTERCTVPTELKKELGHLSGMLADVGGGDVSKGLEIIRKNHMSMELILSIRNTIGNTVLKILVAMFTTGVAGAVWYFISKKS